MSQRSGGGFTAGLFIGALLGASVATLISPENTGGRADRMRELYSRGREIIDAARSDLDAAVDEGKAAAEAQRNRFERLEI